MSDGATEMHAAREATVLVPLTHLSRLQARGDDAATFLHNLLTQDVTGLPADGIRHAGFCSPKGRLLAAFTVWREGASVVLQLPRALAESMRKKLSMYVLRSKVTLTDATEARPALGLAGKNARYGASGSRPCRASRQSDDGNDRGGVRAATGRQDRFESSVRRMSSRGSGRSSSRMQRRRARPPGAGTTSATDWSASGRPRRKSSCRRWSISS
jgi:folate-binding Fe-S cluster repair protein YgfZ